MTDDELKAIEAKVARDPGDPLALECVTLVAEVRRLRVDNAEMATRWIPLGAAQQACADGRDAVVEKLARLADSAHEPDVAEWLRATWHAAKAVR